MTEKANVDPRTGEFDKDNPWIPADSIRRFDDGSILVDQNGAEVVVDSLDGFTFKGGE